MKNDICWYLLLLSLNAGFDTICSIHTEQGVFKNADIWISDSV